MAERSEWREGRGSSTASSCDLLQHVRTQLPYSLFVAAVALAFAYIPSALGLAPHWSLGLAAVVIVAVLLALSRQAGRAGKARSTKLEIRDKPE